MGFLFRKGCRFPVNIQDFIEIPEAGTVISRAVGKLTVVRTDRKGER